MAAVTVTMSADDAKMNAAFARQISQQEKFLQKLKETVSGSKKLSEEEIKAKQKQFEEEQALQKLQTKSVKIISDIRTAQEKYRDSIRESLEMRKQGLLTDEQYQRQLARLKQELRDNTGATERLRAAQEAEQAAIAKADATTRKYMTTVEKLEADLADVKAQYDANKVGAETLRRAEEKLAAEKNKLAEASKGAYQPGLIEQANAGITKYVSSVGLAGAAVAAVGSAWRQVVKEQEAGLSQLKATQDADRKLVQVSSSVQEYQALTAQADALSMQSGVDRNTTRQVLFQAVSEGFRDVVPEIIAANQVLPPESAAGVAGQVPTLFKGSVKAMEALSMTLKAAEYSRLDFAPMAQALPAAAEGAAIAGATPEETMASLAVLASRFKSGEVAADRIKAFATKVGIDPGSVDEEYLTKLQTEKERAATAAKQLRAKEERVADLEKKIASGNVSRDSLGTVQTQLERAKRDVAEFDRSKLNVVDPKRSKPTRESLQGKGIVGAVEALNKMSEDQRSEFLKTDQELNAAYTILKEELPKIKQQVEAYKADRIATAQGGGTLRAKVAIVESDPERQALKQEAIAQRKKEIMEARKKGIEGAKASAALATAATQQMEETLVTRTIGSYINSTLTAAGTSMGLSPETSAELSTRISRAGGMTGLLGSASEVYRQMTAQPATQQPLSTPPANNVVTGTVDPEALPQSNQSAARGVSFGGMARMMTSDSSTLVQVQAESKLDAGEFKGAVDAFTRAVGNLGKMLQPGPRSIPSTAAMRAQAAGANP